ncbi:MAG: hypothetical protein KZQ66_21495, partial [Candidatus Thiodiazotropha sp. (ex Lucinoma aequizonata)]|nr:hypothetical protein [Candidatus Thiodiazotropha sp. (ex Lucinoma aequizonata)]MCU7898791.1 hypothetical protein [Candidatus Thiodiazotropha sp. (ex Lucinoma aequizonata)]MCU7904234.1 hypothetical protein [Candidatus Thiodiazotropha sp. (ex Lucinoma aequizonata)]MCU7914035.1 hypothetical protein [Candidatus Thiodiazotropha sp. (ex Lucinoma aequizonata)]
MTAYCAPTVLRTSRFRIALPQQAARTLLYHDYRNDSTASRIRSLYALHLSLSIAIPAIQPRLRLSGTNRIRSAFHSGQRKTLLIDIAKAVEDADGWLPSDETERCRKRY